MNFEGNFTIQNENQKNSEIAAIERERSIRWEKVQTNVFDDERYYRVVSEDGYKDYLQNDVIRSSPDGTDSHVVNGIEIGHRPTSFPSFDKGAPDLGYAKGDSDNYIFESSIPMYRRGDENPATGNRIKGRHWAYRPIDPATGDIIKDMDSSMVGNIYKLDKEHNLFIQKNNASDIE